METLYFYMRIVELVETNCDMSYTMTTRRLGTLSTALV